MGLPVPARWFARGTRMPWLTAAAPLPTANKCVFPSTTAVFQDDFSMPWPSSGTVTCNGPKRGADLLFTRNYGDEIATPKTRLHKKMTGMDGDAATLR